MRIKIEAQEVYKIGELSDEAQEQAHNEYLNYGHYAWADENAATLNAFCAIFPIITAGWEYGYRNYVNSKMDIGSVDEETAYYDIRGIRLLKYIYNNYGHVLFKKKYLGHLKGKSRYSHIQQENCCVLTGYCADDAILQPLYAFLAKPDKTSSFEDILKDCIEHWVQYCRIDYEYSRSLEYFIEDAEANEREYTKEGKQT